MMSSHLSLLREVNLHQEFHMFAYLKKYHNTEMVYDPIITAVEELASDKKYWTSSEIGNVQGKEYLTPNMPLTRGISFIMRGKLDAEHASNTATRRPRTRLIAYLNFAPVYWILKNQDSVESYLLGSEFIVTKKCCK